jgi:nucleoside-triphosphatase THEP1
MISAANGSAADLRPVAILTGEHGAGKTTACGRLVTGARELGLSPAGIICPARLEGGAKVGIDVADVRTGERRRLAEMDGLPARLRVGPYRFDDSAVAWGVDRLESACPCDLLIVDEIGPLEMTRGEGWVNALEVLRRGRYRLAVVVVRPSLVGSVRDALEAVPTAVAVLKVVEPGPGVLRDLLAPIRNALGQP